MDPYSTGAMLVAELVKRGYHVLALWTKEVQEPLDNPFFIECSSIFVPVSAETRAKLRENALKCLEGSLSGMFFHAFSQAYWIRLRNRGHYPAAALAAMAALDGELEECESMAETAALLRQRVFGELVAVMCGGETGVKAIKHQWTSHISHEDAIETPGTSKCEV